MSLICTNIFFTSSPIIVDILSVLKAKSNPFICALNFISLFYSKTLAWQFFFLPLHHHIPALLFEYLHQHQICFCIFILQKHQLAMFSWSHYIFQLLLNFLFAIVNFFKKLSALPVSNVSFWFFPCTYSNQASAPPLLWNSISLGHQHHYSLVAIYWSFSWSVAFDTIIHSLFFPWLHYTTLTCYPYSFLATSPRSLLLVPSHVINI